MKNKKILIAVILLIIAVAGGVLACSFYPQSNSYDEISQAWQTRVSKINDEHDVDIIIYGDDVEFPEECKELRYTKAKNLDLKKINDDKEYTFLILNDLSGNNPLSKKKVEELKHYADLHNNFNFYYVGTDKMKIMADVFDDNDLIVNKDSSVAYVFFQGIRMEFTGLLWESDNYKYLDVNPYILEQEIIGEVEHVIYGER